MMKKNACGHAALNCTDSHDCPLCRNCTKEVPCVQCIHWNTRLWSLLEGAILKTSWPRGFGSHWLTEYLWFVPEGEIWMQFYTLMYLKYDHKELGWWNVCREHGLSANSVVSLPMEARPIVGTEDLTCQLYVHSKADQLCWANWNGHVTRQE